MMKYLNIILLALVGMSIASCSDDEEPTYPRPDWSAVPEDFANGNPNWTAAQDITGNAPAWTADFSGNDATPVWSDPDKSIYPTSMTAVVRLTPVLEHFATDADMMAAFIGTECRGVAQAVTVDGVKLFFIQVKAASSENGNVEFRYFSSRFGRIYKSVAADVAYVINKIYGTVDAPAYPDFEQSGKYPCIGKAYASIDASLNALAVLIGTDISGLPEGLMTPRPLPEFRQPVDMGVPADLLRRRPDIDEAARSIEAAAAALGIARSEYLPSLSVSASAGTAAHRFKDLFTKESFTYSVMPTLSWTIFDGFGRRYANEEARQSLHMAVDQYNLTVLTAMEEVRSAASNYSSYINYIAQLDNVVANAAESSVLSFDLYRQGLTDFTDVDNAEMNYLTYENTLVTARSNALSALIDLYKALGGSWTNNSDI